MMMMVMVIVMKMMVMNLVIVDSDDYPKILILLHPSENDSYSEDQHHINKHRKNSVIVHCTLTFLKQSKTF